MRLVHSAISPVSRIPGIPHRGAEYQHSLLTTDLPSPEQVMRVVSMSTNETNVAPCTISVLRGFHLYAPSVDHKLTESMTQGLRSRLLAGLSRHDERAALLQLQTRLVGKAATIDSLLVHARLGEGTLVSKLHNLNKALAIGERHGFIAPGRYPMIPGDLTDPADWPSLLTNAKLAFYDVLREVPFGSRVYPTERKKVTLPDEDIAERYPFVEWLKERLGDNLAGVFLYGSAANLEDLSAASDYDCLIKVRDIRAAHKALAYTNPVVFEGGVHYDPYGAIEHFGGKHLGIHLIPEDGPFFERWMRSADDSEAFREIAKVLYGEFDFPIVAEDERLSRSLSHAHDKLRVIDSALDWAWRSPELLVERPALYEFVVKNLRFLVNAGMSARDGVMTRDKLTLADEMASLGFSIPAHSRNPLEIRERIAYAASA